MRYLPIYVRYLREIRPVSGAGLRFNATAMRRDDGEAVFRFADPVGTALLLEEERAIAAVNDRPST